MRYRLGILGGLAIIGIVALGLATGITGSGTVEAARPSVTVTPHELKVVPAATEGGCSFVQEIVWEGSAYAHKSGHYTLFLKPKTAAGVLLPQIIEYGTIAKGDVSGTITSQLHIGSPGAVYSSRIVFFTSRGKGGAQVGSILLTDQPETEWVFC